MSFINESKGKLSVTGSGALGYGAMGLTAFYGAPTSDASAFTVLKAAYDAGCRHFDTAEIYKTGNPFEDNENDLYNETVIGKFLTSVARDSYTVATKFLPMKWQNKADYDTVRKALTASLKRLRLQHIDMYYSHRVGSLEMAIEFAHSAKKLQGEGLIRHIGFSEITGKWLRKCHEVAPVTAVQQEWSLITRSLEAELIPACAELGVAVVAYSPLGRNLLTGVVTEAPNDWRQTLPRYSADNLKKNIELVKKVESIAKKHHSTPAQLSLAWLFHRARQMHVSVMPIPGTTKVENLKSNLAATDLVLDDAEMKVLESIGTEIAGDRADEQYMQLGIEGHSKA